MAPPSTPTITAPTCRRSTAPAGAASLAADRFGIDLEQSWWIGDRLRDVEPARLFGGRGILVESGPVIPTEDPAEFPRVADLGAAVEAVLAAPALHYFPPP
jgi:histidinol phosphatase-like enzyme